MIVNEIQHGRISFAHEGLRKFPRSLVEILRNDITHLDLSSNDIKNFAFLRGFKHLKSLIVDDNPFWWETIPPIDTLELFYANKCQIHSPRSFIYRLTVIFKNLKYLSIMENPAQRREVEEHVWKGKNHRMRMYAIFMIPSLIHINDQKISANERFHSMRYHQYLGPVDCFNWKWSSNPDTDDIRSILSVPILAKIPEVLQMEAQDEVDSWDPAFATFSVSQYFTNYQMRNATKKGFFSSDEPTSGSSNTDADEGLGSSAPSEKCFE